MAYDETMRKAAFLHEFIKARGCGSKFVVRKRADRTTEPIKIFHYNNGVYPFLSQYGHVVARGQKYATMVSVNLDGVYRISAWSYCCPKDIPHRWMGRTIALMRLAKIVEKLGYEVLAMGQRGEANCVVITPSCYVPEDWVPPEERRRIRAEELARRWRQSAQLHGQAINEKMATDCHPIG